MQNPQSAKYKWAAPGLARSVLALGKLKKSLTAAVLLATATGCSEPHELDNAWQAYQAQLSELTSEPVAAIDPTAMPIMPRSADLRIQIDRLSIGLLDSLRLERCRLGQVVAQRNSALGQAQSPSARLRYELDSMLAIDECLQGGAFSDERISGLLSDALRQKQTTLPLYIDQVLTRSEAFRHTMRAANRTHPVSPSTDFDDTYAAFVYFTDTFKSALEGRWQRINLERYNGHMQTLMESDFLPRHWRTMQRSAAWLTSLNEPLRNAVSNGECQLPGGTIDTGQLEDIMLGHFATQIQPALNHWTQHHQALLPLLRQLQTMSVQGQWRAYVAELIAEGSHVEQVEQLTQRHVRLLEQTINACSETPADDVSAAVSSAAKANEVD